MRVVVWLISGALLLVAGWHWVKLDKVIRPKIPKTGEESFRVSVRHWIWNPDISDDARRHAVAGAFALATGMGTASIGVWCRGLPALSILSVGGAVFGLFDVVREYRVFRTRRRWRAG
ncbi:hypothetical protein DA075_30010 [Methylobacterium currus]|uniref:Uncharacterized protein n=1 Tax=Methylobacterium currus TaxID=2051553 RepID=A0A2R4WSR1_9HYPH|nr:hypothetical protein [Methylobacterium currus]AWB24563.1 hypothetical protein DA075_30010 [Methylobacterium currus]